MFTIIAAVGKNNELGKNGGLIWNLPNDLKFFKENTTGKKVFMGKRTYESLPKRLPNREHYVLTDVPMNDEGIHLVYDLEKYINENKDTEEEIFVIGGGMVYKQLAPYAKRFLLTEVDASCDDADTFFPNLDKTLYIKRVITSNNDGDIKYDHVEYIKK